jgi:hypothetical protein
MRKSILVALMISLVGAIGFSQRAEAGVTYELSFRPGGGGVANGDQYTFASSAAANAGSAVMDIVMTNSLPLIFTSISVAFDNSLGLSVGGAQEWFGVAVFNAMAVPLLTYVPIAPGVSIGASSIASFDGAQFPPNAPPSLPVGVYNIGTVVWDTSAASEGIHGISFFLLGGIDATGEVFPGGNIQDTSGTEVFVNGFINIVPEPGTAGLVGLGLTGLLLAARRRRA